MDGLKGFNHSGQMWPLLISPPPQKTHLPGGFRLRRFAMAGQTDDPEEFTAEETQRRVEAALKAAFKMPPQSQKETSAKARKPTRKPISPKD